MNFFECGFNLLIDGNNSKVTIGYQNRPVFDNSGELLSRKGAIALQMQTAI
jgi:hypothetical protein